MKHTNRIAIGIILSFIAIACSLHSAAQGLTLFTSNHDLSSSLIKHVLADSHGSIWVATEDGLNRYDGSKFTSYKHIEGDSTSLAHDFVTYLFEDSKGNLIVSSYKGLQVYDRYTDSFYPNAFNENSRPSINTIIEDHNGHLYGIGHTTVEVFITPDHKVRYEDFKAHDEVPNATKGIVDANGNLWLAVHMRGVYRVGKDGSVKPYHPTNGTLDVTAFCIGHDNVLYAGTNHGVLRYDPMNDTFEVIPLGPGADEIDVADMLTDENGMILIATDGAGLKLFNPVTGELSQTFLPLPDHQRLKVHSIEKDEYGNLWVGIFQKGLLMLPKIENTFSSIKQNIYSNGFIGNSCITSILRDPDGTLWIGTDNDGIYQILPEFNRSIHHSAGVPAVVMSLYSDSADNLWVGAYEGESGIFNKKTGRFTPVPLVTDNGRVARRVYNFAEDKHGRLWIATMGAGVFIYDPATRTATKLKSEIGINDWITTMCYFPESDTVYLGTYDGIYKVSPEPGQSRHVCSDLIVTDLLPDHANGLWVGASTGLLHFDATNHVDKSYDTTAGLPTNTIYSIESDGECLWLGTNAGLVRLNPLSDEIACFTIDDGLQSNEFYKRASFHGQDGIMYFGGINGITYFNPADINNTGKKYDLQLTGFYIGSTPVQGGMKSGSHTIISEPIAEAKVFNLANSDNSFSVEFNTKEFVHPSTLKFFYSFDNGPWERLLNQNATMTSNSGYTLNFSSVESGKHSLRIKAVDNGVESDPLNLTIQIAPVWYMSWWAKSIYCALLLLTLLIIYQIFSRSEKKKQDEMRRKHQEEIQEAKLQFFTNIAHEVRTPLTLVISPLQQLISKDTDPAQLKAHSTILRNANRILRLVNELMDLRKIDNNKMKLKFTSVELCSFIGDLYETFAPTAKAKDIEMEFRHPGIEKLDAWVDPSNFDKILMNLLSNAIKYTPNGGKVDIDLSVGEDNSTSGPLHKYIQVAVTDTGIGIPADERKYIFNRFFRVGNKNTGGSGIGLHLTHSLVVLHHGSISIADNPEGKGISFVVRIPRDNGHLQVSELESPTAAPAQASTERREVMNEARSILTDIVVPTEKKQPRNRKLAYIVEDDEEVRKYLVDNLQHECRIQAFVNGAEAWDAINAKIPDIVISDVMMPQMDGMELTEKIKKHARFNHVPIILLTAKNREEDTIAGLEKGADAYISKPFNLDILIKTMGNLLETRQKLRNVYSGNQNQEDRVEKIEATSNDTKLMERVMKVVNKHLSDSEITVEQIAEEIGISRVHLHRRLKELTNLTTRDFIKNLRLQQGAKLLSETKMTVAEVCYRVGFKHPNNFTVCFKDMYGVTPTEYIAQQRRMRAAGEEASA